jgi:hypothetical protein
MQRACVMYRQNSNSDATCLCDVCRRFYRNKSIVGLLYNQTFGCESDSSNSSIHMYDTEFFSWTPVYIKSRRF